MLRHRLTDREFNAIRHLLPKERNGKKGRPWLSQRNVIDGILSIAKTGSPWRDLPATFGKWQTVYARFRRWTGEKHWDRIYGKLLRQIDGLNKIDRLLWCDDGSVIQAHRSASGMFPKTRKTTNWLR